MTGVSLALGGGNAVAAYDMGAFEAVAERGLHLDHVAGASAGAVTAVLIAGNAPDKRVDALHAFWNEVASPSGEMPWMPDEWRRAMQLADGLQARLLGRPGMFLPRLAPLLDVQAPPGLYDLAPLRTTLAGLVDLERLNNGPTRVSLLAVDIETGEEVVFDNRDGRIELDHVLASSALLPNFPPVAVGNRLLVDGGVAANTPAHLVLDPPRDGLTCFVIDPFPLAAAPPGTLLQAQKRQQDLLFASQTRRTLAALRRIWALDAQLAGGELRGAVWQLAYCDNGAETAIQGFDFGRPALERRSRAGRRDMLAALAAWNGAQPSEPGLTIHSLP